MSLPALGASSPNIPGELAREGAGICLEEIGLESADEVSDIHGSLSLQEQPEELGRDDSSRKQSGGEDGRQQVCSSSSSSWSPCGPLGWRGIAFSHPFSNVRGGGVTVTGPTLLQGQWEVLQTCCRLLLSRDSFSFVVELFGDIHWDFDLGEPHCCTWCPQNRGVPKTVVSPKPQPQWGPMWPVRDRFLQKPFLP